MLVNSRFNQFSVFEETLINSRNVIALLAFVADKMKVSKEQIVNSPVLIAQFYLKLKHLNNETKVEFKKLLERASIDMYGVLDSTRKRELDSI